MRIGVQVLIFLLLSLGVHIALAAVWTPKEPDGQVERSIGGVTLQIGSLVHSSRATVSPVEPQRQTPVETDKTVKPIPVEQQPLTPEIAPKVTAKNAIVPKRFEKQPPVPSRATEKKVVKTAEAKPIELKKAMQPPVKEMLQPKPAPVKKPVEGESMAPTVSNVDELRGGAVASDQGQENMITGGGGKKITQGGNADTSIYRGKVRDRLLQNKFYPRLAKRFRMEGVVTFVFTLRRDGQVAGLRILDSSGHRVLDKAALRMVERSVPFDPFPADIASDYLEFKFPASYTIN